MKEKTPNEFKSLFEQACRWLSLEFKYIKLTAAEKLTILFSALALCAILMLVSLIVLILLALCLVDVFKIMMSPWLACLSVGGILVILVMLVVLLKTQLIINPISRFVSRLIIDRDEKIK